MNEQTQQTEQVLSLLREAGVLELRGLPLSETLMQLDITEATYLDWRRADEGRKTGLHERIQGLEREINLLHTVIEQLSLQRGPGGGRSQGRL